MWVKLNKDWFVRPIFNGFELYSYENNLEIKISDLKYLNLLLSIIRGIEKIPFKNKKITTFLNNLKKKGIISFIDFPLYLTDNNSKVKNIADQLSTKMMGADDSIVKEVYWANPNKSFFSSSLNFFTASYIEKNTNKKGWSFGVDKNKDVAEIKTVMEAFERYSSGIVPHPEIIKSSAEKLGNLAINPNNILPYQNNNKKLFPFSEKQDYLWKEVNILPDNKKAYLPIECIYYPISKKIVPNPCMFANSSGVASGFDFNEALLGAIYEYVERDAFMMTWLNKLTMPQINQNFLSNEIKIRLRMIEEIGYKVYFINITIDIANVVLVALVNKTRDPSLILGLSSNLNVHTACSKALLEAEQQLYWALRKDRPQYKIPKRQDQIKQILDHAAFYRKSSRLKYASFLWSGKVEKEINQNIIHENELKLIINKINSLGMKIIVADLSSQSLSYGIYTIRAIIPGLIPIYFGYNNEPQNLVRLKIVTNKWLKQRPYIHPFS